MSLVTISQNTPFSRPIFPTQATTVTTVKILFALVFLLTGTVCFSQRDIDSLLGKIDPQKWAASIEKHATTIEEKLVVKSQKTLQRLQKQEEKIYQRMLKGKDSLLAREALIDIKSKYQSLQDKLKSPLTSTSAKLYLPKLDTLSTALKFLNQGGAVGHVSSALGKTQSLQDKFQQAEEIKKFIRQRKEQLKAQLEKLGMVRQLKKINKEVYYYSQQVSEYKSMLKDSKKRERKAIGLLTKSKLFKDFMRKNSQLASLFRMPGDPADPLSQAGLAGLQTRAQVNNLIQQQLAAGGPGAQAQFRQNLQSAQGQLNQLKNKIKGLGGSSSEDILPEGFKPNNQKTKGFWKRLELGTNIQTQKASYFFPVTSDIGMSVGYKLNDKSIIGIGGSYKMGLGQGWNHLRVSHEGIGIRSFIDWKIKKSLWLSGGYEMNYKTAFKNIEQLKNVDAWQRSALIGVSKIISIKTRFFKRTKLQLLWDALSYRQLPRTQPVLFRIEYKFSGK